MIIGFKFLSFKPLIDRKKSSHTVSEKRSAESQPRSTSSGNKQTTCVSNKGREIKKKNYHAGQSSTSNSTHQDSEMSLQKSHDYLHSLPDSDEEGKKEQGNPNVFKGSVPGTKKDEAMIELFCGSIGKNTFALIGEGGKFSTEVKKEFLDAYKNCTFRNMVVYKVSWQNYTCVLHICRS